MQQIFLQLIFIRNKTYNYNKIIWIFMIIFCFELQVKKYKTKLIHVLHLVIFGSDGKKSLNRDF